MSKNHVNQKSIAKSLNLSVATVSKALGDSAEINARTRAKVLNMATRLGYDYLGRTKHRSDSKSKFVGVLIHSSPGHDQETAYFAGMSERCAKLNVSLTLHYYNTDDCQQVLDPQMQPPVMRDGQLSGLILVNRWPREIIERLLMELPCVSIVHEVPGIALDMVGIDDASAMAGIMDHLYDLGHRKIGFFGRCSDMSWSSSRFGAYVNSLCRLGIEYDNESIFDISMEDLENKSFAGNALVDCLAEQVNRGVRAWVCVNDWAGYTLSRALMDRGFKVPQDVSITGFDNSEKNRLGCPELTSMSVPALKMGAEALRRLMTRLRHPIGPQLNVRLQCKFVPGKTTSQPLAQNNSDKEDVT
jgi:LacI family transcriptional regulator